MPWISQKYLTEKQKAFHQKKRPTSTRIKKTTQTTPWRYRYRGSRTTYWKKKPNTTGAVSNYKSGQSSKRNTQYPRRKNWSTSSTKPLVTTNKKIPGQKIPRNILLSKNRSASYGRHPRKTYHHSHLKRLVSRMEAFPENILVKHRFVTRKQLTVQQLGVWTDLIFHANNIKNPDLAAPGHSAIGTNEWAKFYERATVVGSKIKVELGSNDVDTTDAQDVVVVKLVDDSNPPVTMTEIIETGMAAYKIINSIAYGNLESLYNGFGLKTYFQVKNVLDNVYQFSWDAKNDINPSQNVYYQIAMSMLETVDVTAPNTRPYSLLITIDYAVLWTKPNTLTEST